MSKNFIVYDQHGIISRIGTCQDDMLSSQAWSGEFVVEGEASYWTDTVDTATGEVVYGGVEPLWQAMDSGQTEKLEPFYTAIKNNRPPKP